MLDRRERFRILTSGDRDVLPRQQTLRALIDWSYDLLDETEQRLFRQLGIFVNGFTIDGATAIGRGALFDEFDVLNALSSLVDKSLVLADPDGTQSYRLLESTRLYALEKLEAQGEREATAERHFSYLHALLTAASRRYEQSGRDADIDGVFAAELDDVRAALDWALAAREGERGGELLAAIGYRWVVIGLQIEGQERLKTFLTVLGDWPALRSRLWTALARLAIYSGPTAEPLEAAAKAVAFARTCGDRGVLARALHIYARNALFAHEFDAAERALEEAEAIPVEGAALRMDLLESRALQGNLTGADPNEAARLYERLRGEHRALANVKPECKIVLLLAEVEHRRENTRQAIALVREALPVARADSNRVPLTVLLSNFAGYLVAVDDLAASAEAAREVICEREPSDPDFHTIVANAMEHLALVLVLSGHYERAARLAGYADAAPHPLGFVRTHTEAKTRDRLVKLLTANIAPADLAALLSEGEALTADAAMALALNGE